MRSLTRETHLCCGTYSYPRPLPRPFIFTRTLFLVAAAGYTCYQNSADNPQCGLRSTYPQSSDGLPNHSDPDSNWSNCINSDSSSHPRTSSSGITSSGLDGGTDRRVSLGFWHRSVLLLAGRWNFLSTSLARDDRNSLPSSTPYPLLMFSSYSSNCER